MSSFQSKTELNDLNLVSCRNESRNHFNFNSNLMKTVVISLLPALSISSLLVPIYWPRAVDQPRHLNRVTVELFVGRWYLYETGDPATANCDRRVWKSAASAAIRRDGECSSRERDVDQLGR